MSHKDWVRLLLGFAIGALIIAGMLLLQGCAGAPMPLTQALEYTQTSLAAARANAQPGATMFECKATVTYQVSTSAGLGTKLGMLPPTLSVGGASGNTVVVEYDAPLCVKQKPAPGDVPVMAPLPEGPFP